MKKTTKRIITFILALMMCIGMALVFPMPAHAASPKYENDGTWISDYDTYKTYNKDDYWLGITVNCHEKMRSTVIVLMEHNQSGQKYFARCEAVNNYKCTLYVPAGDYTVLDIWCPSVEAFDFIIDPSTFTATKTGTGKVEFSMKDIDKWVPDEYGNLKFDENAGSQNDNQNTNPDNNQNDNQNDQNNNQDNTQNDNQNNQTSTPDNNDKTYEEFAAEMVKNLYDTPFEFIKMNEKNVLYYLSSYTGTSRAYMQVHGFSKQACDGIVKITKSGILGEATFQVSVDGGVTYMPTTYVANSGNYISSLGLTIGFSVPKDTDELVEGDIYLFKTIITHSVESSTTPSRAVVLAIGNATKSASYVIEVMSSGAPGVAKVAIYDGSLEEVTDADKTIYTIPADGILKLEDNVQVVFKNMDTYMKGHQFKVKIDIPTEEKLDYTNLYILCGVVGFIGIVIFTILLNKKEKKTDYIINEYKGYQDEDKYK